LPRPVKRLGPFSVHGSGEQIFGVNEQILGPDQSDQGASAYLSVLRSGALNHGLPYAFAVLDEL
jgi:hypothetical protein